MGSSRLAPRRGPVNIVFAVRGSQGFLNGSEVSELLRNLSVVEFSFYLGYPVLQIAEREWCSPGECGCECLRWWTSSNRIARRNPEYKSDKTGASQITRGWASRALLCPRLALLFSSESQGCYPRLYQSWKRWNQRDRVTSLWLPGLKDVKKAAWSRGRG